MGDWKQEFRNLRAGWDSYDAAPISEAAILAAASLPAETRVPLASGGILCGWQSERFTVTIGPNGEQDE